MRLAPRHLAALLLALAAAGCSTSGAGHAGTSPEPATTTTRPSVRPTTPAPPTHRPTTPAPSHSPPRTASAPPPVHAGTSVYVFPIVGCRVSYGHSHHDYPATDIFAKRGCSVVAPVTGRVDEVTRVDNWSSSSNRGQDRGGRSFSIVGDDGVRYYGSHLQDIGAEIAPGLRIAAGALIGHVGDSGSARGTGTHLHFGLSWPTRPGVWWVRRGEVYPWPYLDAWRSGRDTSPAAAVAAEHARQGDVPPCRSYC